MEKAGTGGALFRNLYRDFLEECMAHLGDSRLDKAHRLFTEIAPMWVSVSSSFDKAGSTGSYQELNQASKLLTEIADKEREAMELLLNV
ncbi:hypothetical protein D3C87_1337600 [compost metagenome]